MSKRVPRCEETRPFKKLFQQVILSHRNRKKCDRGTHSFKGTYIISKETKQQDGEYKVDPW